MMFSRNKSLLLLIILMLSMINQSLSKWRNTKKQSYENGNIMALTKHNIECPNKNGLQSFQAMHSGNDYWFKYICYGASIGLTQMKKSYTDHTKFNDVDANRQKSLHFLDRHNVQCKNGYSLQSFQLVTKENKIQYKFKCAETRCKKRVSYKSPTKDMGGNETKFLPSLVVKTPTPNQVLTGFKFQRTKGNQFHYIINYCDLDNSKIKKKEKISNKPKLPSLPRGEPDPVVPPMSPSADLAVKNGNKFCAKNCVINKSYRIKQCMVVSNKFNCKGCTINPKINNPSKKFLCESLCNAVLPNNPCTFFGYINGKIKNVDKSLLNKFNLQLIRR